MDISDYSFLPETITPDELASMWGGAFTEQRVIQLAISGELDIAFQYAGTAHWALGDSPDSLQWIENEDEDEFVLINGPVYVDFEGIMTEDNLLKGTPVALVLPTPYTTGSSERQLHHPISSAKLYLGIPQWVSSDRYVFIRDQVISFSEKHSLPLSPLKPQSLGKNSGNRSQQDLTSRERTNLLATIGVLTGMVCELTKGSVLGNWDDPKKSEVIRKIETFLTDHGLENTGQSSRVLHARIADSVEVLKERKK